MITQLMVIQKITDDGKVEVYQIQSKNFQWTFENRRSIIKDDNAAYFPFCLNGDIEILKRDAGAETRCVLRNNEVIFCDDYGVPSGTVVAILFPENFVPDIIKFKDKPFMPVGLPSQYSSIPPGQFQIFYNFYEKKCAIIFNLHQHIVFGFKCIAKYVTDETYPRNENVFADHLFDVTLSRDFLNVESISNDDLKLINETLEKINKDEIHHIFNELLNAVKSGQTEKTRTLLGTISNLLINGTATLSNLTTIADSYKAGGLSKQFLAKVIEYVNL